MNARIWSGVGILLVCGLVLAGCVTRGAESPSAGGDYRLSGPYTHNNLTIYLVHGADTIRAGRLLTLQEAMDQKKVVVYETGSVNELAVENVSTDVEVFVQSGDIVKGGRQDRTIGTDFILPAKSGKTPIASYCVEHGRWSGRGGESSAQFSSAGKMVVGKQM